jgi:hypothetical protein
MPHANLTLDPYIPETLMRDLVGHDRHPAAFLVYLWLYAQQQRSPSGLAISYQDLAESIGISKSSAQTAVSWLIRRKLLATTKATLTATPIYKVLTPWKTRSTPKS